MARTIRARTRDDLYEVELRGRPRQIQKRVKQNLVKEIGALMIDED